MKNLTLAICLFCCSTLLATREDPFKKGLHTLDPKFLKNFHPPMALPPVAPDEKATLEKAWDAAKQHFIEIMELGGESSLGIRLGKKEKRTSQEEALFQTYNKLKAKGDRPKDLDRLAKELYYLHTLEIAASYEYLRPIVAAPLIEQLIKANRENLPGMIKGKLLGDFKKTHPNPSTAELKDIDKEAEALAIKLAPDYDKQMESQALKLADNYIMELLYGLTDPVTMEKNKALPGVGKKVKLEAGRTKALISVYKDIKHPFLKEKSAIFRKLFGEPPAIELSDAEKKLPKAEQDKILSDKRVKRSTNLRDERIEALSTNFDELLKETGLFVAPK